MIVAESLGCLTPDSMSLASSGTSQGNDGNSSSQLENSEATYNM